MMRNVLLFLVAITAIAAIMACNSQESHITQLPKLPSAQTPQPVVAQNPAEKARRITAEELHTLWEQGKVLIVDTRTEPAYKQNHIKGAILIPSGDVANRLAELPRDKMIVTYCT